MSALHTIKKTVRNLELKYMLRGKDHSAGRIGEMVDTVIGWARRDEAEGVRRDKVLFDFESTFEEISDEIAQLRDRGELETYREIYGKLYRFAVEMMESSYMPLYLYILYRYANALLETGEAEEALEMFEKLREGTDRLIGIRNSYGIHCLECRAVAAVKSGQPEKAGEALKEMNEIAVKEFGPCSAMAMAVRRFAGRIRSEGTGRGQI